MKGSAAAWVAANGAKGGKGGNGPPKGFGKNPAKGQGDGKNRSAVTRSNLTIAERRAKLDEIRRNSRCLRCGGVGHWAGDAACRLSTRGQKVSTSPAPAGYFAINGDGSDSSVDDEQPAIQRVLQAIWLIPPALGVQPVGWSTRFQALGLCFPSQHKGLTYGRVLHTYSGYVTWGRGERARGRNLAHFLDWVQEYCTVDSETLEVQLRPEPPAASAHATATIRKGVEHVPQCTVCKDFSKTSSNAYIDMRTFKVCGRIFRTKKEQLVNDPLTCTHPTLERRGSSRRTSRLKCTMCVWHCCG